MKFLDVNKEIYYSLYAILCLLFIWKKLCECIVYKRANVNVVSFSTEIAFHSFRINNFKQDRFSYYSFLVTMVYFYGN